MAKMTSETFTIRKNFSTLPIIMDHPEYLDKGIFFMKMKRYTLGQKKVDPT